jgi:hypothetical protein
MFLETCSMETHDCCKVFCSNEKDEGKQPCSIYLVVKGPHCSSQPKFLELLKNVHMASGRGG